MNQTANYSIQRLPESDRPRERLIQHGPESMTTAELIAIILGSGMKGMPVLQLAQEIVNRFGDVQNLADATLSELCTIKGLGQAKALQLKAAVSLSLRMTRQAWTGRYRIENPSHAYNLIKDELEREHCELFVGILQDTKGFVISQQTISIGTLSHAIVHPREVFYPAIRHNAASIIVAHNHPSGDPTPSDQDISITKTLIKAGRLIGIPCNDHLIIGDRCFISMREQGEVNFDDQ